ncbi:hypothetical protein DFJ73DRAFT_918546 [Zopfochytrium polystomum]|nr:hypothetical protein DFJ73DRAFT_918546 [Zopfochytrium polystomum]
MARSTLTIHPPVAPHPSGPHNHFFLPPGAFAAAFAFPGGGRGTLFTASTFPADPTAPRFFAGNWIPLAPLPPPPPPGGDGLPVGIIARATASGCGRGGGGGGSGPVGGGPGGGRCGGGASIGCDARTNRTAPLCCSSPRSWRYRNPSSATAAAARIVASRSSFWMRAAAAAATAAERWWWGPLVLVALTWAWEERGGIVSWWEA